MTEVVKIGVIGILSVLLAAQFKSTKSEYSLYIAFGVAILIFSYIIKYLYSLVMQMENLKEYLSGSYSYLKTLLKIVGITYICEFCAGICKDAGYQSVASQIEIMGKLSVMIAGMPILMAVIEQINSFL